MTGRERKGRMVGCCERERGKDFGSLYGGGGRLKERREDLRTKEEGE